MGARTREAHEQIPARDAGEEAAAGLRDRSPNAEAPAGEGRPGEEHDPSPRQEEGELNKEDVGARKVGRDAETYTVPQYNARLVIMESLLVSNMTETCIECQRKQ